METVVMTEQKTIGATYGLDVTKIIAILRDDSVNPERHPRFKLMFKDFSLRVLNSMGDTLLRQLACKEEFCDEHLKEIEKRTEFFASQCAGILENLINDYYRESIRLLGEKYGTRS